MKQRAVHVAEHRVGGFVRKKKEKKKQGPQQQEEMAQAAEAAAAGGMLLVSALRDTGRCLVRHSERERDSRTGWGGSRESAGQVGERE